MAAKDTQDLGPLLTTWAVCEWRLRKVDRARYCYHYYYAATAGLYCCALLQSVRE
jgi:hypothetical protein